MVNLCNLAPGGENAILKVGCRFLNFSANESGQNLTVRIFGTSGDQMLNFLEFFVETTPTVEFHTDIA